MTPLEVALLGVIGMVVFSVIFAILCGEDY